VRTILGSAVFAVLLVGTGAAADRPLPSISVWTGEYRCTQGLTAVRLALDIRRNGEVEASFQFGPHPENPSVPTGEVAMKGQVTVLARGQFRLHLEPDHWVSKPGATWEMVGLTATSDVEHRSLEGKIDHERCGEFRVQRAE
jgi:hypothetical protein